MAVRTIRKPKVDWTSGVEQFLTDRGLSSTTRRSYSLALVSVGEHLPTGVWADMTADDIHQAVAAAYPDVAPATWNRVVATVSSYCAYASSRGWTGQDLASALNRRKEQVRHDRGLTSEELERLWKSQAPVRDRCLWRMLYETAARAQEILGLNVEDLDLPRKRATVVRKGGDVDVVHWQTGSARLLPYVIDGRTSGPLFLSSRPAATDRAIAALDQDPETGLPRLSYRRAAESFRDASGHTLHELRHAALTHLAEAGVPLPLLMAKSRHQSIRSLQRYVNPSVEAVARLTAEMDPARRR